MRTLSINTCMDFLVLETKNYIIVFMIYTIFCKNTIKPAYNKKKSVSLLVKSGTIYVVYEIFALLRSGD